VDFRWRLGIGCFGISISTTREDEGMKHIRVLSKEELPIAANNDVKEKPVKLKRA
jgi:hypothetical protein